MVKMLNETCVYDYIIVVMVINVVVAIYQL